MTPPFRNFDEPTDALVYYTGCAIGTLENAMSIKKHSQADRKRFASIANDMVWHVGKFLGIHSEEYKRLEMRLKRATEGT